MFKKLLAPVLLVLCSLGVFVLAVEIYYRVFPDRIPRSIEHLARARIYAFEPDIGVVLRPGIDVRVTVPRLGREVRIRTFAHGLDIGFRDDGPQGGGRIVVTGDSYAFGYGVDQDESFPVQLERRLRRAGLPIDVVNAGVPGFSPRLERIMLEKYLVRLEPEVVLAALYVNDLSDSIYYERRRFGRIRTFLGVHSTLYQLISAARAHRARAAHRAGVREAHGGGADEDRFADGYRIIRAELARMGQFSRRSGIAFGVIILPSEPPLQVERLLPAGADYPVLDLGPRFAGLPREAYRNPHVGHLTPAANEWVAADLQRFIEAERLLGVAADAKAARAGGGD